METGKAATDSEMMWLYPEYLAFALLAGRRQSFLTGALPAVSRSVSNESGEPGPDWLRCATLN